MIKYSIFSLILALFLLTGCENNKMIINDVTEREANEIIVFLASKGIATVENLADLAVDDLVDITGMDAERAKQLIMTARAPWFA